ncbi:hypothetical protein MGALJ_48420 [Mycobacterium gallinarum]|uniref:Putative antitoxin VapB45-like DNA-binding HTH domain-containing protein n=1 Tax=Mycobacterium gallinarum TaxID=39689 RepID=A0A9W4B6Y7_9MYCO|nr:hypothetical protein MGALJ_48420 [Mycobacterium gallinarum]
MGGYCHDVVVSTTKVIDLQDRPVYGFGQVDHILGLKAGTSARWIDGYQRRGKSYPPVIRPEPTGDEVVTWGEFVEARLLAEYRDAGVPLVRMRPAVETLREELDTLYPLASAKTWLAVEGRELVRKVQDAVGLDRRLLIVVRNDQQMLDWSAPAQEFADSLEWETVGRRKRPEVTRLRPDPAIRDVVVDPLQRFGEPSTRGVPTEVIRELYAAGDPIEMIAELYGLPRELVEAAVRYELRAAEAYAARAS